MVLYGPVWSNMVLCGPEWTHMVLNHPVLRIGPYGPLLSRMASFGPVGPYLLEIYYFFHPWYQTIR